MAALFLLTVVGTLAVEEVVRATVRRSQRRLARSRVGRFVISLVSRRNQLESIPDDKWMTTIGRVSFPWVTVSMLTDPSRKETLGLPTTEQTPDTRMLCNSRFVKLFKISNLGSSREWMFPSTLRISS